MQKKTASPLHHLLVIPRGSFPELSFFFLTKLTQTQGSDSNGKLLNDKACSKALCGDRKTEIDRGRHPGDSGAAGPRVIGQSYPGDKLTENNHSLTRVHSQPLSHTPTR